MTTATDPYDLYPGLDLLQGQRRKNTSHAFYLGVEFGRTPIAWQLGKRYMQDEPLKWGCAVRPAVGEDPLSPHAYQPEGTNLKAGTRRRGVP